MFEEFRLHWLAIGLFPSIRAVLRGLPQDPQNFYGIMELYNPDTRTFFTPLGELGNPYHKLQSVSGLDYGEFVYEERVPPSSKLKVLFDRYSQEFPDIFW